MLAEVDAGEADGKREGDGDGDGSPGGGTSPQGQPAEGAVEGDGEKGVAAGVGEGGLVADGPGQDGPSAVEELFERVVEGEGARDGVQEQRGGVAMALVHQAEQDHDQGGGENLDRAHQGEGVHQGVKPGRLECVNFELQGDVRRVERAEHREESREGKQAGERAEHGEYDRGGDNLRLSVDEIAQELDFSFSGGWGFPARTKCAAYFRSVQG